MNILYLLIPIGLVILALSIKLLFWAINNGQYDDLDMEGHRILFDDDERLTSKEATKNNNSKDLQPDISTSKKDLSDNDSADG